MLVPFFLATIVVAALARAAPPHILVIVADDLGYNDVGFRCLNCSVPIRTPNLDRIAASGTVLDNYYVQTVCSPSRACLMTGRYPAHTGINNAMLPNDAYSLPLDQVTIAQKMKSAGYDTHMVGKWHLGMHKWEATPTFRGFDSFFGMYQGAEDYFTHRIELAYDLHDQPSPNCGKGCSRVPSEKLDLYSTHMFTSEATKVIENHDASRPLFLYLAYQAVHASALWSAQVPEEYENMYTGIQDKSRRKFAGMVTAMDEGIGNVTKALADRGMLDNTVVVFFSDNGGPTNLLCAGIGASNWPLRGGKCSIWEGGVRSLAMMQAPQSFAPKAGHWNGLMHAVDWMPTLGHIAGFDTSDMKIDGMDMWDELQRHDQSPRKEVYIGYTEANSGLHGPALRMGNFKLIRNGAGNGTWILPATRGTSDDQLELYDISVDQEERHDIAGQQPAIVAEIKSRMDEIVAGSIPQAEPDPSCPAMKFGFDSKVGLVWEPWC